LSLNISAGHNLNLNGNPQYSGGVSAGKGNLAVSGNPTLSAGSINMNIKYVDVIICERNISAPGQCNINAGD
jgi:hypothetical protein